MKRKTKLEIINETAEFYDSENRATESSNCQYSTLDGRKCAVGRCMLDEHLQLIRRNKFEGGVGSLRRHMKSDIDDLLKPEYRGHPEIFWSRLQDFHDEKTNWTKTGLTPQGRKMQESLIREFCT